jgi:hypothetical protein
VFAFVRILSGNVGRSLNGILPLAMRGERPVVLGIIGIPIVVLVILFIIIEDDRVVVLDGRTRTRTRRADFREELACRRSGVDVTDFETDLGDGGIGVGLMEGRVGGTLFVLRGGTSGMRSRRSRCSCGCEMRNEVMKPRLARVMNHDRLLGLAPKKVSDKPDSDLQLGGSIFFWLVEA